MCSTPRSGLALKIPTPISTSLDLGSRHFHSTFKESNENVERLQQQRMQAFAAKEPSFQQQIDLEHVRCPSHLVEFNRVLATLSDKQTLKISSHSKALINDLAASSRILHLPIQALSFRRQHFLYVTKAA